VEFIRRFKQDYGADVHYLVENTGPTRYSIEAATDCRENADRMKTERPIRLTGTGKCLPAGGEFGQ